MAQANKKSAAKSAAPKRLIEPLPIGVQRKLSVQIMVWTVTLLSIAFAVYAYRQYT